MEKLGILESREHPLRLSYIFAVTELPSDEGPLLGEMSNSFPRTTAGHRIAIRAKPAVTSLSPFWIRCRFRSERRCGTVPDSCFGAVALYRRRRTFRHRRGASSCELAARAEAEGVGHVVGGQGCAVLRRVLTWELRVFGFLGTGARGTCPCTSPSSSVGTESGAAVSGGAWNMRS